MHNPPTLLCVATFPANTGFAWTFLEGLYARVAEQLAPEGVRTLVAYPRIDAPPATLAGSPAEPVVLSLQPESVGDTRRVLQWLRKERVRTILFMDRPARHWTYPLFRAAGVERIVVYDHTSGTRTRPGGLKRLAKRLLGGLPFYSADLVLAVSGYVATRQRDVGLTSARRVRTLWNGVAVPEPGRVRPERLGIPADTPLIICACRATPEKGVADVLAAMDLLPRTTPGPAPVLAFAGTGPALESLERQRQELTAADRVRFLGYRDDVPSLMAGADLCVVPSLWEDAFPLAVLQAMAMGKPVVATTVGGIPEMIDSPDVGRLVPPGEPATLAAAMAELLADPARRHRIGTAARHRVATAFRPEAQIAGLVDSVRTRGLRGA